MGRAIGKSILITLVIYLFAFVTPANSHAEEDVLRMLVWEGYAPEKLRRKFETMVKERFGRKVTIQVKYVEGSESFYAPIRKKEVDLVTLTHHHFDDERFNYITNGLLISVDTKNISDYDEIIPSLRNASYLRRDNKIFGVPICQGLYALVYNTDKVKTAPTSWRVLWSPEYNGDFVIGAKEYLYNICTAALAIGHKRASISRFDTLNNEIFKKHLRSLVLNAGGFWIGQDKADDLSGKSLSVGWGDSVSTLRRRGEIWRFAEPLEGSICWVDSYSITWALSHKPFLKKVAEEWINFLLKPEFQVDYIIREISQRPTTVTVEPMLTDAEKKRLQFENANYYSEQCILLPTYSQRDRNGLKLLWEEAMMGVKIKTGGNP